MHNNTASRKAQHDDRGKAAGTRFNVALALAQSGRVADAREYARAALCNFETYGAGAAQEIQRTQQLLMSAVLAG